MKSIGNTSVLQKEFTQWETFWAIFGDTKRYLSWKIARNFGTSLDVDSRRQSTDPYFPRTPHVEFGCRILVFFFLTWRIREIYPRDVRSIGVFVTDYILYTRDERRIPGSPWNILSGRGRFHPLISCFSSEANWPCECSPNQPSNALGTATILNFTADTSSVQINNAPYLL